MFPPARMGVRVRASRAGQQRLAQKIDVIGIGEALCSHVRGMRVT